MSTKYKKPWIVFRYISFYYIQKLHLASGYVIYMPAKKEPKEEPKERKRKQEIFLNDPFPRCHVLKLKSNHK